ncbi:hypothetical protein GE300_00975 [Rhodobacteraceae bacterium 2CG4]|uniref:Glutamine amidotransferase domain-containing protein n=1 Tax=Halovulum marinum TaxID=2662447 RepID=A0A6L5YUS8_9RHOB|nr:type 1 glutamine amidotransferase [Halovulum marinum]MSU88186.1 hypothetical protein [Halovulum marinum]
MRIGILKTGDLPEDITARHGDYGDIFARLLQATDPGIEPVKIDLDGGAAPGRPQDADGWIVTGSRHGTYEDHPWIPPLESFLRAAVAARIPVFGVCFGHQVLAQALGGRVAKSERGWGLGVQGYDKHGAPAWLQALPDRWAGYAIHQDQVIALPEGATVQASSPFCPFAVLAYGDPDAPHAASVQSHPEYSPALLRDLAAGRLGRKVPAEVLEPALESLAAPVDNPAWARTMVDFLKAGAARRRSAA